MLKAVADGRRRSDGGGGGGWVVRGVGMMDGRGMGCHGMVEAFGGVGRRVVCATLHFASPARDEMAPCRRARRFFFFFLPVTGDDAAAIHLAASRRSACSFVQVLRGQELVLLFIWSHAGVRFLFASSAILADLGSFFFVQAIISSFIYGDWWYEGTPS